MFEKYNFAGVFIQIQAVLTLYAQGAYKDDWRLKVSIFVNFPFFLTSLEKINSKSHHDDFVMFLLETLRVNATITTHFIRTLPTIF